MQSMRAFGVLILSLAFCGVYGSKLFIGDCSYGFCHQLCKAISENVMSCDCKEGFKLMEDGRRCTIASENEKQIVTKLTSNKSEEGSGGEGHEISVFNCDNDDGNCDGSQTKISEEESSGEGTITDEEDGSNSTATKLLPSTTENTASEETNLSNTPIPVVNKTQEYTNTTNSPNTTMMEMKPTTAITISSNDSKISTKSVTKENGTLNFTTNVSDHTEISTTSKLPTSTVGNATKIITVGVTSDLVNSNTTIEPKSTNPESTEATSKPTEATSETTATTSEPTEATSEPTDTTALTTDEAASTTSDITSESTYGTTIYDKTTDPTTVVTTKRVVLPLNATNSSSRYETSLLVKPTPSLDDVSSSYSSSQISSALDRNKSSPSTKSIEVKPSISQKPTQKLHVRLSSNRGLDKSKVMLKPTSSNSKSIIGKPTKRKLPSSTNPSKSQRQQPPKSTVIKQKTTTTRKTSESNSVEVIVTNNPRERKEQTIISINGDNNLVDNTTPSTPSKKVIVRRGSSACRHLMATSLLMFTSSVLIYLVVV